MVVSKADADLAAALEAKRRRRRCLSSSNLVRSSAYRLMFSSCFLSFEIDAFFRVFCRVSYERDWEPVSYERDSAPVS